MAKSFAQLNTELNESYKPKGVLLKLSNYIKKSVPDIELDIVDKGNEWYEVWISDALDHGSETIGFIKTNLETWQWRSIWSSTQSGTAFDNLSDVKAFLKKKIAPELVKERE